MDLLKLRSENTVYYNSLITPIDRERLNGHKSVVIWFTGLSGSGKSTIAHAVEKRLFSLGCRTFVFDGDIAGVRLKFVKKEM